MLIFFLLIDFFGDIIVEYACLYVYIYAKIEYVNFYDFFSVHRMFMIFFCCNFVHRILMIFLSIVFSLSIYVYVHIVYVLENCAWSKSFMNMFILRIEEKGKNKKRKCLI